MMVLLPIAVTAQSEYESFVDSLPKKNLTGKDIRTFYEEREKAYLESELYQFQKIDTTSLKSVWNFYNGPILKKYTDGEHSDFYKLKFIQYAVRGFDLRLKENAEGTRQLIVYTKALVKLRSSYDVDFSFSCIAAIKDLISKEELNYMVKTERFKVRHGLEIWSKNLAEVEKDPNPQKREVKNEIRHLEYLVALLSKLDSDFAALIIP